MSTIETGTDSVIKDLGLQIAQVDVVLMGAIRRRMDLSAQVVARKVELGHPRIFNPDREDERIERVKEWARKHGINANFAAALLYLIIDESCKVQTDLLQMKGGDLVLPSRGDPRERHAALRPNLIELTRCVAESYEESYASAYFATRAHDTHERAHIRGLFAATSDRSLLLDLGCASGRIGRSLAGSFAQVTGYDLSEDMIRVATENAHAEALENTVFRVADLENGIPERDASVSFAVMNQGTASDLLDLPGFMKELHRVLKPGAKFLLSFYNKDALLYKWGFMPLDVGLAAMVNVHGHCLDVRVHDQLFSVFARAYGASEVRKLITTSGLVVDEIFAYPTIASILPTALLDGPEQEEVQAAVSTLDEQLTAETYGAYLTVLGTKRP
ncbi:methyltransferase domain-containing protein [Candidatus Kaiserbacteria bacterium]|nr:methyltransferase domain-containing protein [Candidatus Kaiserbacteria bacterium]